MTPCSDSEERYTRKWKGSAREEHAYNKPEQLLIVSACIRPRFFRHEDVQTDLEITAPRVPSKL